MPNHWELKTEIFHLQNTFWTSLVSSSQLYIAAISSIVLNSLS